jgi:hypothetical protein
VLFFFLILLVFVSGPEPEWNALALLMKLAVEKGLSCLQIFGDPSW